MGKKDAQRTKGNTKSSSSARSAQFLGENVGFVGFGTSTETAFVPIISNSSDPSDEVPADMRLVLRKMHKKDQTTKIKALQEFLDVAENLTEAEMVSLLPFWPSVYNKLATDCDGRVRELAHTCLLGVVTRVGRSLATCLKTLSGVWYLARFDPHTPAATAADTAWVTAFPPHKQAGALSFCQSEIMELVTEHLTLATPQTLSDPVTTSPEEMEAKFTRTLAMSFSALASLLRSLDQKRLQALLERPKFWKYAKNKYASIRQSFYELLFQLCLHLPSVAQEHTKSVATAVLTNLQETELGPATAVWTAALQVVTSLPGAWSHVSPGKAVLPPVYKMMASGGAGLAPHTFSNLMPFLSQVPASVLTAEDSKVAERWLHSLQTGLNTQLEASKTRRDELEAVTSAYLECVMLILNMEVIDHDLKVKVLEEHLLDGLVIKSLSERKLSEGSLYKNLATFLGSWDTRESVSKLNTLLWSRLTHLCVEVVVSDTDVWSVTTLLSELNTSDKISSVKAVICRLWTELVSQLGEERGEERHLVTLGSLSHLVQKCQLKSDARIVSRLFQSESIEKFLETAVIPLLRSDSLVTSATSLLFTIVSLMDDEGSASDTLVSASLSHNSEAVIIELLSQFSRHPDSPLYRPWLNNPKIKQFTVSYLIKVEEELRNIDKKPVKNQGAVDVIYSILGTSLDFTDEEMQAILTTFRSGLENTEKILRPYTDFVSKVCKQLTQIKGARIWSHGTGAKVALLLFKVHFGEDRTFEKEEVWLCGCLNSDTDSDLWREMMEHINCLLELDNMCMSDLNILSRVCLQLFDKRSLSEFVKLLKHHPVNANQALIEDILDQRTWISSDCELESVILDAEFVSQVNLSAVRANFLLCKMIIENYFPPGDDDNKEPETLNDTVPESARVDVDKEVIQFIIQILNSYSFLTKITERDQSHVNGISLQEELHKCLRSVVTRLSKTSYLVLREKVLEASLEDGGLASVSLHWLVRSVFTTSEWDPRLASLLPLRYSWSGPEVTHTASVLHLASELGPGDTDLLASITDLVTASLVSLGDSWSVTSDSLLWLLGQCLSLTPGGQMEAVTEHLTSVMVIIQAATADTKDQLLYNRSLAGISWGEAARVASLARFLAVTISSVPGVMTPELWDLACCSLVSWASSFEESLPGVTSSAPASLVTSAVCQLASAVGQATSGSSDSVPQKLRYEWDEFFSEGVYSVLIPAFVSLSSGLKRAPTSLLKRLASAVSLCPPALLMEAQLPALHLVQDVDITLPLPDNITFLYNHLTPLLLSPCRHVQVAASLLLMTVAQNMKEKEDEDQEEEEETQEIPRRLEEVIKQGDTVLDTILQEFRIGEAAGPIPPGNASHTVTVGYLLCWRVVLALLEAAGDELRPKYTEYLKTRGLLDSLFGHLFRLLPKTAASDKEMFLTELSVTSTSSAAEIQQMAGSTWVSVCRHLPAVARSWWQSLDKVGREAVERLTSSVVTPTLWREETLAIERAERGSDNMTVRVRPSVREVVATYTIDEGSLELLISLPANYPLGGLTVDSGNRVGVEVAQWRKWMLQLTTFLSYQNGTILGGLNLWKRNVDKRFEGVEECYICFYILHGTNHTLPKLACRTCKKKFHSACLYKWFSTSNNSSCPLCRNLF